jgi:hypothetical protein
MLGVTSQEANSAASADGEDSTAPAKKGLIDEIKAFWSQSLKIVLGFFQRASSIKGIKLKKVKDSQSKVMIDSDYSSSTASDDVQAWLDSISAKSEQKASNKVIIASSGQKRPVTRKAAGKKPTGKR